jgi:5S rRNA maturation endonuclease (ribonuclease M5)
MRYNYRKKEALVELRKQLADIHNYVEIILVEGIRDVHSLRTLGCMAEIDVLNHANISDYDLAEEISTKYQNALILTDFDEEGINLNQRFSKLLERKGVKLESGLRLRIANLLAKIGTYTIESLDNIFNEIV